uniref:Uncharacterized protein n=1 Tax=Glossina pallidipes TaxID=7398 RepID=A0A1A9ZVG2_GLOPL
MLRKAIKSKVELFVPPPDEGHVVVSNTVVDSVSDTLACVRPELALPSRSVTDDVSDTKESPIVVPELGFKLSSRVHSLIFVFEIDVSLREQFEFDTVVTEALLVLELVMLLEPVPTVLKRKTSGLPVMRCNAKYDSNACKFKAVAAGELTGSNAACCRLLTIVPCSDSTTAAAAAKSLVVVVVLEVLQFLMTVLPEVVTSFIVVVVL